MNIIILGGSGMLGSDLQQACFHHRFHVTTHSWPDVDIAREDSIAPLLVNTNCVINCAAYTRVDDAEKEREQAYAVNAEGAGVVARLCAKRGLRLIHISTDYIFDGQKGSPYIESDKPCPLSYYGLTKLQGEEAVSAAGGHSLILRTQSLYGLQGRNFVKAILQKIQQGQKVLRVVQDQISSPTYTRHLAEALIRLIPLPVEGVVHVASSGACSWFEFAKAIVDKTHASVAVEPIQADQLKLPAKRPAFSVLDTTRYAQWTGSSMPTWQQGLDDYLKEEPLAHRASVI